MNPHIRKALTSDVDRIWELEKLSFPDPWPQFLFEEILENPQQELYVAEINHEVAGYIIFWKILREIHILNICVASGERKKGVGSALLKFCLKQKEGDSFFLEVRASNFIAQQFYRKFGFVENFVRKNYYPNHEDAVVMVLSK